jgi:hypothetical protein
MNWPKAPTLRSPQLPTLCVNDVVRPRLNAVILNGGCGLYLEPAHENEDLSFWSTSMRFARAVWSKTMLNHVESALT